MVGLVCSWAAHADEPGALGKAPVLLHYVEAPSPPSLADRRTVDVFLDIDVDDQGKVAKVAVTQSGGAEFDAAALEAARKFEFSPGEADGKPVPVRVSFRYRFLWKEVKRIAPVEPKPTAPPSEVAAAPISEGVPFEGRILRKGDRTPVPLDDGNPRPAVGDGLDDVLSS